MKRPMLESEKNFITCGVMMAFVGAGLIAMSKVNPGIICIVIGIGFIITAIYMYKTNDNRPAEKPQKQDREQKTKKEDDISGDNDKDNKGDKE